MADIIHLAFQIGLLVALGAMFYAILQVVDVIREERERLMWYRQTKVPVRNEDHDTAE